MCLAGCVSQGETTDEAMAHNREEGLKARRIPMLQIEEHEEMV
jgi:predicted RNase H-like HicB family nuclease